MPACCSPRHAFRFYDATGRRLGDFIVCFECGCTDLDPRLPEAYGKDVAIRWNREALAAIVTAHGLTPLAPPHG